mmetsp:Transcript_35687/g.83277  ORF Transcript_35687/g.83277 Transcript_35687/m.83277 type:complete len:252 (+) Transcript_35687:144-899(+)
MPAPAGSSPKRQRRPSASSSGLEKEAAATIPQSISGRRWCCGETVSGSGTYSSSRKPEETPTTPAATYCGTKVTATKVPSKPSGATIVEYSYNLGDQIDSPSAITNTKAKVERKDVCMRASGQHDWMRVPMRREVKVDVSRRSSKYVTGKESNTVKKGSTATKISKGASSPNMRMKYFGKVASRWRKVARAPTATMSEMVSSFQKGFEPHTTRIVARTPWKSEGIGSSAPLSSGASWHTRTLRMQHEAAQV